MIKREQPSFLERHRALAPFHAKGITMIPKTAAIKIANHVSDEKRHYQIQITKVAEDYFFAYNKLWDIKAEGKTADEAVKSCQDGIRAALAVSKELARCRP